ncbi:MAG: hypothetical protein NBV65_09945 [Burkholderiaceae bacterium]|nr:hypothetical protein [Burkholderiaceae bacterium]
MNSLKIDAASFESTVETSETLVLQFVRDDADALANRGLAGMFPQTVFAHVNVNEAPSVARMFAVADEAAVAIFRQKIILHFDKSAPDVEKLGYLLQQISTLDMDKIRMNIEKDKAEQALHMRRACPTVRGRVI